MSHPSHWSLLSVWSSLDAPIKSVLNFLQQLAVLPVLFELTAWPPPLL